MAWLKSHKWVLVPETRIERRHILNVRESRHTAMVNEKRYYDVENGKFITDKLHTINSYSLGDIIDDCIHNNMSYHGERHSYLTEQQEEQIGWFVPKDNDFDEECRLDEERKRQEEEQKKLDEIISFREKLKEEQIKKQSSYNPTLKAARLTEGKWVIIYVHNENKIEYHQEFILKEMYALSHFDIEGYTIMKAIKFAE